jgi:hypothetical protein
MIRKGKEMKFSVLQNISAVTAVLVASSAFASMTTLTASNITGTGVYEQASTMWSIQFTFDGALTQDSLDGDFGNWTLTVTGSNGSSWSKSNSDSIGGEFTPITNGRIYKVFLDDGSNGISGSTALIPVPTFLSIQYTTLKTDDLYMNLGQALDYSASSTTPNLQKGRLSVTHVNGEGNVDGEISGIFTVPAPGSVALIGLVGLVSSRRRRN